jgi:hypothetical protein
MVVQDGGAADTPYNEVDSWREPLLREASTKKSKGGYYYGIRANGC